MNESQRTTLTLFSYLQRDGQMKKWFTNKPREPPSFSEILIFLISEKRRKIYVLQFKRKWSENSESAQTERPDTGSEKLNISMCTIGRIERGEQGLSIDLLIEISVYFGVQTDYILLGYSIQTESVKQQIRELIPKLQRLEQTM